MPWIRSWILAILLGHLPLAAACAAPPDPNTFFEKKVRPVLIERCAECHGKEKPKGGLRLDSRAALLSGGDRGPALIPGKPEQSLLVQALLHSDELKMPPKRKLPEAEIAAIKEWVRLGASWPDSTSAPAAVVAQDRPFTPEERAFWAFQPVRRTAVPVVQQTEQVRNPIDAFILAKLQAAGVSPAAPVDRRTLIRRVTYDLTGLPPSLREIEAFVADDSPEAYERLVDRLLASPAYGEKWGRRWLDVARYADSNGMDENLAYTNAWRYRDWVIRSINADKPYDQFVREQLAGDLIPGGTEAEKADRLTATGFLVIGPKMLAEDDPVKMRMDIIDEQMDTAAQAFMGLTLGCARCHDHKFDPITMTDYYGLAGLFYSTKTMQNYSVVAVWQERSIGSAEVVAAIAAHDGKIAAARDRVRQSEKPRLGAVGGSALAQGLRNAFRDRLAALEKSRPQVDEVMAVSDDKPQNLRVHLRGSHLTLGPEAPRRFPRILAGDTPLSPGSRSGRWEFAQWLTRPEHPLTARVMVNRIWTGHFGSGLVRTPDNFGRLGERPTHPELLDWLAAEFMNPTLAPAPAWSMKHLHRLIVTSSTYRMSTGANPTDPENRLLSHFPRRRLDAEEIRDGMLAVAGLLIRTMGGSLLTVNRRQYVTGTGNKNYEGYSHPRRSVYLPVIRSAVYDVFQTLDFPDPSVLSGQRPTTTIPTQALLMMNSALADQTAEAIARSICHGHSNQADRIRGAYRQILGRDPTSREIEVVTAFLKRSEAASDRKLPTTTREALAWRGFCRTLLASNEFVFVE